MVSADLPELRWWAGAGIELSSNLADELQRLGAATGEEPNRRRQETKLPQEPLDPPTLEVPEHFRSRRNARPFRSR
jgi:hypothetical protein